jgi:hypothetical protein
MAIITDLAEYIMADKDALGVAAEDIAEAIATDLEHFFQDEKNAFAEEDVTEAWETDDDYFSWMTGDILYLLMQSDKANAEDYLENFFEAWDGPGFGIDLKEEYVAPLKKMIGDELLSLMLDAGQAKGLF